MKKTLALILAVALCLSLTACVVNAPVPELPSSETPVSTQARTEPPATEAPTEEAGTPSLHGVVEGNTYTNELLNFRITLPEGWVFYTEEQIAAQNNISAELFEGSDIAETIKEAGQMVDMMAVKGDGSNANLVIQPAQAVMNVYTDKQIFDLLEPTYKAQFSSSGMEIKEYETVEMPVLGQDRAALRIVIEMSGIQMTEYQIWLRDNPDYYGVLTVTSTENTASNTEALLEGVATIY